MKNKNVQKVSVLLMLVVLLIQSVMTPILAIADTDSLQVENKILLNKLEVETKDEQEVATVSLETEVTNKTDEEQTYLVEVNLSVELSSSTSPFPTGVIVKVNQKKIEVIVEPATTTKVPLKLSVAKTATNQELIVTTDNGNQQKHIKIPQITVAESTTETTTAEETSSETEVEPESEKETATTAEEIQEVSQSTVESTSEKTETIDSTTTEETISTETTESTIESESETTTSEIDSSESVSDTSAEATTESSIKETTESSTEKKAMKSAAKVDPQADEDEPVRTEPKELSDDEITLKDFILTDSQGNPPSADHPLDPYSEAGVKIAFDWKLEEGDLRDVIAGDTYNFQLPEALFKILDINAAPGSIVFEGNLGDYGEYVITAEGQVTFTFNERAATENIVEGKVEIFSFIDVTKIEEGSSLEFDNPFSESNEEKIVIYFKPSGGTALSKEGKLDSKFQPKSVTWNVDINTSMDKLVAPTITDNIPADLALVPDSIVIYPVKVDVATGKVLPGSEGTPLVSDAYTIVKNSDNELEIKFNELSGDAAYQAYRITYKTDVKDNDFEDDPEHPRVWENEVTLSDDGKDVSDSASVTPKYGKLLNKTRTNYNPATQTMTWQIEYNTGMKKIGAGQGVFTDTWNQPMIFDKDAVRVYEASVNSEDGTVTKGSPITSGYTITEQETSGETTGGFTLTFDGEIDGTTYIIEYETTLDKQIDGNDVSLENTVAADGYSESKSGGTFEQQGVIKTGTPNYENKTIAWSIGLNNNKYEMHHLIVHDTFPEGLSLVADSLELRVQGSETLLIEGTDYEFEKTPNDEGFTLTFIGDYAVTEEAFTLTYVTNFERQEDKTTRFPNHVKIDWEDSQENKHSNETETPGLPENHEFTGNNGDKEGTYNPQDKTIDWVINTNYESKDIHGSYVIEDVLPGNQELVSGSVKAHVYQIDPSTGAITITEELTSGFTVDTSDPTKIRVTFDDSTKAKKTLGIIFQTKFKEDKVVDAIVKNTASVIVDGNKAYELEKEVIVRNGNKFGVKEGKQIEGTNRLAWKIELNPNGSTISDYKLVDTISGEDAPEDSDSMLLADTIKVYKASLSATGDVEKGELADSSEYTLEINNSAKQFTLSFNDVIDQPYILEYETMIDATGAFAEVSNKYEITGNAGELIEGGSSSAEGVRISGSKGTGKGKRGDLKIIKKGENQALDSTNATQGIFELWDSRGRTQLMTESLNADGELIFPNLVAGTYRIVERKAPGGYAIDPKYADRGPGTGKGFSTYLNLDSNHKTTPLAFEVEDPRFKVELRKEDKNGNLIGNQTNFATFKLFKGEAPDGVEVTENAPYEAKDGRLTLELTEPGNYYVIEEQAVEGYIRNTAPISFEVKENANGTQTLIDPVKIVNYQGSVTWKKVNENNQGIAGAVFELVNAADDTVIPAKEATSTASGEVKIEGIAPGTYYLREKKAAPDYILNPTKSANFTIDPTKEEGAVDVDLNEDEDPLVNYRRKAFMEKVYTSAEPTSGAKFVIKNVATGQYYSSENATTGVITWGTKANAQRFEEENNKVISPALGAGNYEFEEVEVAGGLDGYILNSRNVAFTITGEQTEGTATVPQADYDTQETMINYQANFTLTKVFESNDVTDKSGYTFDLYQGSTPIQTGLITDSDGEITIPHLGAGSYELRETGGPAGSTYLRNTTPLTFTVSSAANDNETSKLELSKSFTNYRGKIRVIKEFEDGSITNINKTATFRLQNADGNYYDGIDSNGLAIFNPTGSTFTTNAATGIYIFEGLVDGEYQLEEVSSADGYIRMTGSMTITIQEGYPGSNATVEQHVTNHKGKAVLKKVDGSEAQIPLSGAEFIVYDKTDLMKKPVGNVTFRNTNEVFVTGLDAGKTYIIEEKTPPKNHIRTDVTYEFTIPLETSDGTVEVNQGIRSDRSAPAILEDMILTNYQGSATLIKQDKDGNQIPLEDGDATFKVVKDGDTAETPQGTVTIKDGKVHVTGLGSGTYRFVETSAPEGYLINTDGSATFTIGDIENEHEQVFPDELELKNYKGSVSFTKQNGSNEGIEGAEFAFYRDGEDTPLKEALTTDRNGHILVDELAPGDYYFVETKPAPGYQLNAAKVPVTIDGAANGEPVAKIASLTNELTRITFTKYGEAKQGLDKTAVDGATFILSRDKGGSTEYYTGPNNRVDIDADWTTVKADAVLFTSGSNGQVTINGLRPDSYTIEETSAPVRFEEIDEENWHTLTFEIDADGNASFASGSEITNIRETTEFEVTKVWNDQENAFNTRPESIRLTLQRQVGDNPAVNVPGVDPVDVTPETVNGEEVWTHTFKDLVKYDEANNAYTFSVVETKVANYETPQYSDEGKTVTNVLELTDVSGEKVWNDGNNSQQSRPTTPVTIELLGNGDPVLKNGSPVIATLEANNTYKFENLPKFDSFENLPKFDSSGNLIRYTVRDSIAGYTSSSNIDGTELTNTLDSTSITVTKVWEGDAAVASMTRPESIQLQLYSREKNSSAPFVAVTPANIQTISGSTAEWSYTFEGLAKYQNIEDELVELEYAVKEVASESLNGYEVSYEEDDLEFALNGQEITNTLKTTDVPVAKRWAGEPADYNDRPASVTFVLDRYVAGQTEVDGQAIASHQLTGNDWEYSFTGLPTYDKNGNAYNYQVRETDLNDGYTPSGPIVENGTQVITNIFVPDTAISVTKDWQDTSDESIRPESIVVILSRYTTDANNPVELTRATLNADNDWTTLFDDLPKYNSDNERYTYLIEEVAVFGYTSQAAITTETGKHVTITNTLDTVNIPVKKVWDDHGFTVEHQNSVRFTLTRQTEAGETDPSFVSRTLTLDLTTNWQGAWNGLAKVDKEGNPFMYTVTEVETDIPPGYTASAPVSVDADEVVEAEPLTITNTLDPTDITITKVWEDHSNAFNTRPTAITFNLMKNIGTTEEPNLVPVVKNDNSLTQADATLDDSATDEWTYSFTGLPKYEDGKEIQYTVVETNAPKNYESSVTGTTLTNTLPTVAIAGTKNWQDDDDKYTTRPALAAINAIDVTLYVKGEEIPVQKGGQDVTTKLVATEEEPNGHYSFTDLPKLDADGNEITYIVKDSVKGYVSSSNDGATELTNTLETPVEIKGQKIWMGSNNTPITDAAFLPAEITIYLTRKVKDSTEDFVKLAETEQKITAANDWEYSFDNQPQYNQANEEYEYLVREEVPNGYTFTPDPANRTLTNKLQTTKVTATKVWEDSGEENSRPDEITFKLYRSVEGGQPEEVETKSLTRDDKLLLSDNWQIEFTDLPTHNREGKKYIYTVDESDKPDWYTKDIQQEDNEVTITNTVLKPGEVAVEKVWNDLDDTSSRPSEITVHLYRSIEGTPFSTEAYQTQILKAEDFDENARTWSYVFKELPTQDKNGEPYIYQVTEEAVTGYTTTLENEGQTKTITNTLNSVEIQGTKDWEDAQNMSARPAQVTIELYRKLVTEEDFPEEALRSQPITAPWTYDFGKLAATDSNSTAYEYKVAEVPVAGYETSITGSTVTNTLDTISVEATKIWEDNDNSFGTRPDEVTFQLMRRTASGLVPVQKVTESNGELVSETITKTLTEDDADDEDDNKWIVAFTDLPKVDNQGTIIEYVVQEMPTETDKPLLGYTTTYSDDHLTVTNTLDVTHEVEVTKEWQDHQNEANTRPESITFELQRNGSSALDTQGEPITATVTGEMTADTWRHTFTGLPKYDGNGTEFTYTVTEKAINGYTRTDDGAGLTVVNGLITDQKLSVKKVWQGDEDHKQATRPTSIHVQLFRQLDDELKLVTDAGVINELTLNEANEWTGEFTGLPQYQQGDSTKPFVYVAREMAADELVGYTPTYAFDEEENQYVVTNTLQTTKEISVKKIWEDVTDKTSRPDKITLEVVPYIDGQEDMSFTHRKQIEVTGTTDTDEWTAEITGLPTHNKDGKEYTYGVREIDVPHGYRDVSSASLTTAITNELIPQDAISVRKIWENKNDGNTEQIQPGITVQLYRHIDGEMEELVNTTTLTADKLSHLFTGLAKQNKNGHTYIYTVKEVVPDGYDAVIDVAELGTQVDITNTLKTTDVTIEKIWEDTSDRSIRPDYIDFTLYRYTTDEDKRQEVQVNSETTLTANGWRTTFTGLALKDASGADYTYTVEEANVNGYQDPIITTEKSSEGQKVTITNRLEITQVHAMKVWSDNDNALNTRPTSITLNLMRHVGDELEPVTRLVAGGEELVTAIVEPDSEDNWSHSFTGLPKFDQMGEPIVYTVEEVPVNGYQTTYTGETDEQTGEVTTTITNTFQPVTLTGWKIWNDHDNVWGTRPDGIQLNLYRHTASDTEPKLVTATITTKNQNWEYTFDNLPAYNQVSEKYIYTIEEEVVPGYERTNSEVAWQIGTEPVLTVENTLMTPISLSGTKSWIGDESFATVRPTTVTIELLRDGQPALDTNGEPIMTTTDSQGKYYFTGLPAFEKANTNKPFEYSVREITPAGYQAHLADVVADEDNATKLIQNIENELQTTKIDVKKVWVDDTDNSSRQSVTFEVVPMIDGEVDEAFTNHPTVTLNPDDAGFFSQNTWTGEITGLPMYNSEGKLYEYTIREVNVPNGYEATVTDNRTITNTLLEKGDILVEKIWKDEQDTSVRPASITFNLYRQVQGKPETKTLFKEAMSLEPSPSETSGSRWTYKLEGLADKNKDGEAYVYSVEEHEVAGYTTEVDNSDTQTKVITNELKATDVTIKKVWEDAHDQSIRPTSITFNLYREIKDQPETKVLFRENVIFTPLDKTSATWEMKLVNLAANDSTGKEFIYTVEEHAVSGYTSTTEATTMTNSLQTTSLSIEKKWRDQDNQFGLRPESIHLQVMKVKDDTLVPAERSVVRDGEVMTETIEATVDEDDEWTYTFANLPRVDTTGETISYRVIESPVAGYDTIYSDDDLTITNTLQTTTLEGDKIWDDLDNQYELRPEEVTVYVTRNGERWTDVPAQTLSEDNWHYHFANLPTIDAQGKPYVYAVVEEPVADYTAEMRDGEMINHLNTMKVIVTKEWIDEKNQANKRPDTVTVKLYASDVFIKDLVLTGEDWQAVTTVPATFKGQKVIYSIEEIPVEGYDSEVSGSASSGFTVTNTYQPTEPEESTTESTNTSETESSSTPETESTNTSETDSSSTPETGSTNTSETESSSTTETESTSTSETDSSSTPETESTSTSETESSSTPETESTSTSETDSSSTPETESTSETDSSSTPETESTSTSETDSSSTPETESTSTSETDSSSTTETESTSTSETDSSSTPETESTSTSETDSSSTSETESTNTSETDSSSTPETESTSTSETDSSNTTETDSSSTTTGTTSNGKPGTSNSPNTNNKTDNSNQSGYLPQTGEVQSWLLFIVGMGLIGSAVTLGLKRRKK
jgi:LPXTG-motif cell wall-anchored protein